MRREAEGSSFPLSSATPIISKSQNRLRSSSLYSFSVFTRSVMHFPLPTSAGMLPDKIHPNAVIKVYTDKYVNFRSFSRKDVCQLQSV
ncbi:hypothetical protein T01_830 [Trichinella spiralis]|uniref:Uncharacterized protein n=1 Tax=Trichinella spiralis TaxID=6334 RepID=A0A0V0Z2V9_TRISP|nr:hypothetical protein T01_830 [Trichinella spiralis]